MRFLMSSRMGEYPGSPGLQASFGSNTRSKRYSSPTLLLCHPWLSQSSLEGESSTFDIARVSRSTKRLIYFQRLVLTARWGS
jgi:hypothetical protein